MRRAILDRRAQGNFHVDSSRLIHPRAPRLRPLPGFAITDIISSRFTKNRSAKSLGRIAPLARMMDLISSAEGGCPFVWIFVASSKSAALLKLSDLSRSHWMISSVVKSGIAWQGTYSTYLFKQGLCRN